MRRRMTRGLMALRNEATRCEGAGQCGGAGRKGAGPEGAGRGEAEAGGADGSAPATKVPTVVEPAVVKERQTVQDVPVLPARIRAGVCHQVGKLDAELPLLQNEVELLLIAEPFEALGLNSPEGKPNARRGLPLEPTLWCSGVVPRGNPTQGGGHPSSPASCEAR
ncbi:unnamed protein product [Phytophthora lilii]|uniref:Unnamed protein product n=1 Tax=Phytophthora lilii TaxID=2077276 RepID=A0A9W6WST8_9STRA|nr:unnamed protein product [Phytophthora lilii]